MAAIFCISMFLALFVSWLSAMYCDVFKKVKSPQFYWTIGLLGGFLVGVFMMLFVG